MTDQASVSPATSYIGTVLGVAQLLNSFGIDGYGLLRDAGVDVHASPGFEDRVPADLLHAALMEHARDHIDPLFGLRFADYVNPTTYHAFGVMLTSSTSLRAFCQRLERYYAYINTAAALMLDPSEVMLVAAHNADLVAAASTGYRTAFVPRPTEYGPDQETDQKAEHEFSYVATDFNDLADQLGCG